MPLLEAKLTWAKIVEIEAKLIEELECDSPLDARILDYLNALVETHDPRVIGAFLVLVWPCFEVGRFLTHPLEFALPETLRHEFLNRLSDFVTRYPVENLHEIDRSIRERGRDRWAVLVGHAGWKWRVAPPDLIGSTPEFLYPVEFCILACHANGYVRERAVAMLANARSEIAIRFLVLRSMDRVEQVAARAADASDAILAETPELILEVLPLVPRLARSSRPKAKQLYTRILEVLTATAQRDLLVRAVRSSDRQISRTAAKIADELDDIALQPIAKGVARSRDAVTRSWAMKWEARLRRAAPTFAQDLRVQFLADPVSTLRADALRAHIAVGGDIAAITAALSDPSASVRETARYHMGDMTRQQFAEFYRSAIRSAESAHKLAGNISGLGEVGDQADGASLRRFLSASPRTARAAMRTLAKLDPSNSRDLFVEMLGDPRLGVQCQALRLIAGRLTEADVLTLRRHIAAVTVEGRRPLAMAMLRLPVWESLASLLELAQIDLEAAAAALTLWKAESRPLYAPPRLNPSDGNRLKVALSSVAGALNQDVADYIAKELSYWMKA